MKLFSAIKSLFVVGACAFAFASALPVQKASAQLFGWGEPNVEGRHVVSFKTTHAAGSIVVSFGDRRLYYILPGNKAISYPIAIPKGEAAWSGNFSVTDKKVNPVWTPTEDMRRQNPKLPAFVAGGDPRNPLGVRALYVGDTLYRIHGTDAPWLIGDAVSHGCVRMFNKDVVDLYDRVPVGTKIIVTWNKFNTSKSPSYASGNSSRNVNFSRSVFNLDF